MENEFLEALLRVNFAAGAAILAVLAIRSFIRRQFGARAAYALWLLAPAASLAVLMPPRQIAFELTAAPERAPYFESAGDPSLALVAGKAGEALPAIKEPSVKKTVAISAGGILSVWLGGAFAYAGLLFWRQRRFMRRLGALRQESGPLFRAESAGIGPAMIGAFRPRIILPSDFEARFRADERRLILAHERMHLSTGDGIANFALAGAQAACWFNPLVHIAARFVREDQELACDAAVMARFPAARRTYAEALIKAQTLVCNVPLGNAWPTSGEHPLARRIAGLSQIASAPKRIIGLVSVSLLAAIAGAAAWAAQPPTIVAKAAETKALESTVGEATADSKEIVLADAGMPRASREDIAREAALKNAAPLGATSVHAATGVALEEIAAVLTIIAEDRDDVAVEYQAARGLPAARAYVSGDTLVIDGGLNLDEHPCTERFSANGVARLPTVGNFRASDLPRLVVRTPRQIDVTVGGAVLATVGPSAGGYVSSHGCGDMTIAQASGSLDASLMGFGDVEIADQTAPLRASLYGLGDMRIGRTADAELNLIGVGDLDAKASSGSVKGFLQGTGNLQIASIAKGAILDLPGAGDFRIGAIAGPFSFKSGGAGRADIASLNGEKAEIESWGSSAVDIAAGRVDVIDVKLSGASRASFGGSARQVRAVFSDSGGDFEIGDADDVDQVRNGVAAGRVKITGQ